MVAYTLVPVMHVYLYFFLKLYVPFNNLRRTKQTILRKTVQKFGYVLFGAQTYYIYRSWTKEADLQCLQNNFANVEYLLRQKEAHDCAFDASTAQMCLRIIEKRQSIKEKLSLPPEDGGHRQYCQPFHKSQYDLLDYISGDALAQKNMV